MSEWWLISNESVKKLKDEIGKGWMHDAMHTLDEALHSAEDHEVPPEE